MRRALNRKKPYYGKLGVRPDHLRGRIEITFCVWGSLREVVLNFKFRQNRLSDFGVVRD